ncbi:uncharacterized protein RHOBADRAFT_47707 [Rhodotorula graminis WP1]|uniref:Oxidoreductase-like domain-containing protein n=1 Tax=Rhodotorula graminis (strain WP1) TaxID=578459 RepID=A0A0P9GFC8_RHOGW|nr:uncharacterized protein RHOBADRAFT_47707 [Rhodotorula graminis WP1]KPV71529.1 hypothetical protein RHOBADRAFT_47707 [Rhodotorula graminis WP1]
MTRSSLQRTLRLLPSGHWAPSPLPLNLALRHPRTRAPAPPHQPDPPPRRPAFDTLASDATAAPSLQGVPAPLDGTKPGDGGARTALPLDAAAHQGPAEGARGPPVTMTRKRTVLGVELPTKPKPPEPDECCMSGCATCVYDLYLEDVEHFHAEALERRERVLDVLRRQRGGAAGREGEGESEGGRARVWGTSEEEDGAPSGWGEAVDVLGPWSDAVRDLAAAASSSASSSSAGAGAQSDAERADEARDKAERELKRARDALDPGMRAFLEMEARIKAKQREQAASARPASPAPGSSSLSSSPPAPAT